MSRHSLVRKVRKERAVHKRCHPLFERQWLHTTSLGSTGLPTLTCSQAWLWAGTARSHSLHHDALQIRCNAMDMNVLSELCIRLHLASSEQGGWRQGIQHPRASSECGAAARSLRVRGINSFWVGSGHVARAGVSLNPCAAREAAAAQGPGAAAGAGARGRRQRRKVRRGAGRCMSCTGVPTDLEEGGRAVECAVGGGGGAKSLQGAQARRLRTGAAPEIS